MFSFNLTYKMTLSYFFHNEFTFPFKYTILIPKLQNWAAIFIMILVPIAPASEVFMLVTWVLVITLTKTTSMATYLLNKTVKIEKCCYAAVSIHISFKTSKWNNSWSNESKVGMNQNDCKSFMKFHYCLPQLFPHYSFMFLVLGWWSSKLFHWWTTPDCAVILYDVM